MNRANARCINVTTKGKIYKFAKMCINLLAFLIFISVGKINISSEHNANEDTATGSVVG